MDDYKWGFLAGLGAVLVVAAIMKLFIRKKPMSVTERADYLSKRRARMLPLLAIIFLSQQATYFSTPSHSPHSADQVKIAAWLVLSVLLVAALATKGFWLESREIRDLLDDENTRANRVEAMRIGFFCAMVAGFAVYFLTMIEPLTAREAVHVITSAGIAAALIRWGMLERRAHQDV